VTVEEIVPRSVIRAQPDRTVVPGFLVSAVVPVAWGAYPSYVDGVYGRDDDAYADWDRISRKPETTQAWLDAEIRGVPDFPAYIARREPDRLQRLKDEGARK
jgi:glutaconate CoA-transferase subunit A